MACYDSAREITSLNVLDWAKNAENLGAGEILLTLLIEMALLKAWM